MNQTPISSMRVCVCVNGSFEKMRSYSRNKYFSLTHVAHIAFYKDSRWKFQVGVELGTLLFS